MSVSSVLESNGLDLTRRMVCPRTGWEPTPLHIKTTISAEKQKLHKK